MIWWITAFFTLVALLAVALHFRYLREVNLDRLALIDAIATGQIKEIVQVRDVDPKDMLADATNKVYAQVASMGINLVVALVGLGSLAAFHPIGWLLVAIPVISVTVSWFNLRGRRK